MNNIDSNFRAEMANYHFENFLIGFLGMSIVLLIIVSFEFLTKKKKKMYYDDKEKED